MRNTVVYRTRAIAGSADMPVPKRPKGKYLGLADIWGECFTGMKPSALADVHPLNVCSEIGPGSWVKIVALCLTVAIICSIDRTAMSVAILPMSKQYGWTSSVKGAVSGSFNIGHMITNLLGGWAAAVWSPKDVLSIGVIVWSAFTILTPWAASTGWLPMLLLVRAIMGLGEGVAFPTMQAIIKGWIPADKRSRSLGAVYSGHQIGSILSLLFSPLLLAHGVDALFVVYGTAGFLWLALWHPLVPPHPPLAPRQTNDSNDTEATVAVLASGAQHHRSSHAHGPYGSQYTSTSQFSSSSSSYASPSCSLSGHAHAGLHHIAHMSADASSGGPSGGGALSPKGSGAFGASSAGESPIGAGGGGIGGGSGVGGPSLRLRDVPWREFARSRPVWGIAVAHATFGITYNIVISWLPTYYAEVFSLNVRASSFLSVLPWAAMALGTNVSGWAADALINKKVLSPTKTRKALQLVGCLGPGLSLLYLGAAPQAGFLLEAVTCLTFALGFLGCQAGGFASNHQDIATRYAPVLFGLTNAGASLAGSAGVYAVGAILDRTGSWSLVLLLVAAANFLSAALYALLATSEPLFD